MSLLSPLVTDSASGITYRVNEPAPARPLALLVLLHGVGGNETNLAQIAANVSGDTLVVLARGPLILGPEQYAWFRVVFAAAGPEIVASEADASRLALIRLVSDLQTRYGIDAAHTVVVGFSQGGIMSASVGLSAPESVKGFAVLAGRILPEIEPVLAPRERLAGLQALIAHGRSDDKLPVSWAERAHALLEDLEVAHELRLYPGGHGVSPAMAQDFHGWLNALLTPVALNELRLHLGPDEVRIVGRQAGEPGWRIALGIGAIVREQFAQPGSLTLKMEAAIAAIEDELALVPKALHRATIASNSPSLRDIARAAGLGETATGLGREAVEQVFNRQVAVAQGRPAASEGLPDDLAFVAGLLMVRELMHHLDIASISLTP